MILAVRMMMKGFVVPVMTAVARHLLLLVVVTATVLMMAATDCGSLSAAALNFSASFFAR